jgi:hypothetical protein
VGIPRSGARDFGIVEEGNKSVGFILATHSGIVLAGKYVIPFEIRVLAAEPPDNGAVFGGDFVDGVAVAAGK